MISNDADRLKILEALHRQVQYLDLNDRLSPHQIANALLVLLNVLIDERQPKTFTAAD